MQCKKILISAVAAVMLLSGAGAGAGDSVQIPVSAAEVQSVSVKRPKAVKVKTAVSGKKVTLSWNKTKCSGYRIYVYKKGKWVLSVKVAASKTSFTYKSLPAGKYTFRVVPVNRYGSKVYKSLNNVSKTVTVGSAAKTPVSQHGKLSVKGANIVDQYGKVFKIKGMSTHGIMWENFGDVLSYNSLKVLRDDWKINTIRAAMYTEEYAGYTTGAQYASQAKAKVTAAVENAKKLGMYVIVDWHILNDNDPNRHKSEANKFFKEMAKKYKNCNNVIFEICNEPNGGVTWSEQIKPYCKTIVNTIRSQGFKGLIVCGTGTWSQDIDQVLGNRLDDKNCLYTLHFYANTHTDWLRNRLKSCYSKGLPVLVTEFGTCDASGNGGYNEYQSKEWFKLLDRLKVGYINWSLGNKAETASAFKTGTDLKNIKKGTSQLTQSGKLIRAWFRAH